MSARIQEFLSELDPAQFDVLYKLIRAEPHVFLGKEREAYEEFCMRLDIEKEDRDEKTFRAEDLEEE